MNNELVHEWFIHKSESIQFNSALEFYSLTQLLLAASTYKISLSHALSHMMAIDNAVILTNQRVYSGKIRTLPLNFAFITWANTTWYSLFLSWICSHKCWFSAGRGTCSKQCQSDISVAVTQVLCTWRSLVHWTRCKVRAQWPLTFDQLIS